MRPLLVALLLGLAAARAYAVEEKPKVVPPAPAAAPKIEAPDRVVYHDDKLTVHVHGVPARAVLDEVGRQTGAEVKGELRVNDDVTVEFDDVPLHEALQRLVRDQNFTIGYADAGRLSSIELLGGPLAPPDKTADAKAGKEAVVTEASGGDPQGRRIGPWPPDELKPKTDRLWAMFTDDKQLPVSGKLAEALGSRRATFKQIAFAAARDDDPAVRARALLAGLNTIESDPALRDAFVATVQSLGDEGVAHFLRQFAGDHAEEWVARWARHSYDPNLRPMVAPVLDRLGTLGPEK